MRIATDMQGAETVAPFTMPNKPGRDRLTASDSVLPVRPSMQMIRSAATTATVSFAVRRSIRGSDEVVTISRLVSCHSHKPLADVGLRRGTEPSANPQLPPAVANYLGRYPQVVPTLEQAEREILKYFPSDTRLKLDLLEDPETGEAELFIVVRSSLDAERSGAAMDRLLDNWFINQEPVRQGLLAIVDESSVPMS